MLGAPYHPQSQDAIEAFNKYIQNWLYKTYDNIKIWWRGNEFDRNMEFRFNDIQFSSWLQLKNNAYDRIYSLKNILLLQ